MCEALKLPSRSLAWQLNHIFYDAAGGYCAVPTFLRVFPVSAPCLSSSFKSIYCSQKSIRLSEERCRFSGYGSQLSHFLPHTHTDTLVGKKNCDGQGACVSFLFFFFFFFWVVTVRKKCHTSLEKEQGRAKPFPWAAKSMDGGFHLLGQRHKKHFYAGSNHITPCHHPSLGQSFLLPPVSLLNVGKFSLFFTKLSHQITLYSSLPLYSSPLLSSPPSLLQSSALPSHCRLSPP